LKSNHPPHVESRLIQSLHNRASTICQERQDLFNETWSPAQRSSPRFHIGLWTKSKNPVILSSVHHRQKHLEPIDLLFQMRWIYFILIKSLINCRIALSILWMW
jgi:hypothetical protein